MKMPSRAAPLLIALLVVVLHVALCLHNLSDETTILYDAYYSLIRARSFLETGDWLAIYSNHQPDFNKPPLQYMATALLMARGVPDIVALRVFSFLAMAGVILATGWLAHAVAPSRIWAVPGSMLLVAGSEQLTLLGRSGLLDTGMTFFLLLSLCAVLLADRHARWWVVAGLAMGLGSLQKAPVPAIACVFIVGGLSLWRTPGYAWNRLKHDRHFITGCVIAFVLSAAWPLTQSARFGIPFIDKFMGEQMIVRFLPAWPGGGARKGADAIPWVTGAIQDNPYLWVVALGIVVTVLLLPGLRKDRKLAMLCVYIAATLATLTLARGWTYPRYLLILTPVLAVVTAVVLGRCIRPSWVAATLCAVPLLLHAPRLQRARSPVPRNTQALIEVCRAAAAEAGMEDTVLFCKTRPLNLFPPGAFVYYAGLPGHVLTMDFDRWEIFHRRVALGEVHPPFVGISLRRDLEFWTEKFGRLERMSPVGDYVVWRAPRIAADD